VDEAARHQRRSRLLFAAALTCVLQLGGILVASSATADTPTANDSVYPLGTAPFFGSPGSAQTSPTVAIAPTATGLGYRTLNAVGHIST
jgi:hypothetical protein